MTPARYMLERLQPYTLTLFGLTVFLSLVRWGGTAKPGPLFVLGVSLVVLTLAGFGALAYWLLLSPLPKRLEPPAASAGLYGFTGSLVVISGFLFLMGGLWDEAWHLQYGGFGDDFLWPPHLLIYSALAFMALFAWGGLLFVLLRGRGGLRQRFRQEPLVGLLGLVSSYLILFLPLDELWHRIYGLDLTAWSLPHLLIAGGSILVMLAAVPLQLSLVPPASWRGLRGLRYPEALVLLLFVWTTLMLTLVGVTEWQNLRTVHEPAGNPFRDAFWLRPEWLYPVLLLSIALFSGNAVQQALKRAGVATLVGLGVLSVRLVAVFAFGGGSSGMSALSQTLLLVPFVAPDLNAYRQLRRGQEPGVVGNLFATLAFLLVALPVIHQSMIYPRINAATLPGIILMSFVMGTLSGWAGKSLGEGLTRLRREVGLERNPRLPYLVGGTLAAALAVVLVTALRAAPPV